MLEKIGNIKNNVWNGIAIGFLVPLLPVSLAWWAIHHIQALRQADLLLIAGVALNAWLMNYFFRINKDHLAKGIISITFLWAFAFFAYKVR